MRDQIRLDALGKRFVASCDTLLPFKKYGNLLYLAWEKFHTVLHSASAIMRRKIRSIAAARPQKRTINNVKGPGNNTNNRESLAGTLLTHARREKTGRQAGSAIQGNV